MESPRPFGGRGIVEEVGFYRGSILFDCIGGGFHAKLDIFSFEAVITGSLGLSAEVWFLYRDFVFPHLYLGSVRF